MRILHTEWSDGLGGQEKRILAESCGLQDRGHYVSIACRNSARIKIDAEKCGITAHTIPMRSSYDIQSIFKLVGLMRQERFDVINTHSGVDSWLGGIASKISAGPVLVRTRHLNIPLKRNFLNFIHFLPDVYITCGENMRNNLVTESGFPATKVVSIPTGVDSDFFHIEQGKEFREKYGIENNSPVISNVGILRRVKGHEVTFDAVKRVLEYAPNAKFLIVGDGPRREALENYVHELGVARHIIFTGFIEDVREVYSISDVTILSSWSEGLPQSIVQAMASGVPVVATNVGGVPEVVIEGETGILVEPGNSEALANGIIRILNDEGLSSRVAHNAKEYVMKKYSMKHMIDMIEDLYKNLLKSKNG